MAEKTGIAWCDHTFNPWIGCTKVGPGCDSCYAEALDKRHRWKGAEHWGAGVPRLRTSQSNWEQPRRWDRKAKATGSRRLVFCASLADVFDNEVEQRWRDDLFKLIIDTPNLMWLLLTKRIGNARKMLEGVSSLYGAMMDSNDNYRPLPNVWLGTSVVNQEEADRDIPKLLATPAAKRFVSYEPALGPVEFDAYLYSAECCGRPTVRGNHLDNDEQVCCEERIGPKLDWIIVGGESSQGGAKARPFDVDWAGYTVHQCREAGCPCFVKQLGSCAATFEATGDFKTHGGKRQIKMVGTRIPLKDRAGADPAEWHHTLRVQEFPA